MINKREHFVLLLICFFIGLFILSGGTNKEYIETKQEYEKLSFEIAENIVNGGNKVNEYTTYEAIKKLQSYENKSRIKRMQELLETMKQAKEPREFLGYYEVLIEQYSSITSLRDSFNKWEQMNKDERFEMVTKYLNIKLSYNMKLDKKQEKES